MLNIFYELWLAQRRNAITIDGLYFADTLVLDESREFVWLSRHYSDSKIVQRHKESPTPTHQFLSECNQYSAGARQSLGSSHSFAIDSTKRQEITNSNHVVVATYSRVNSNSEIEIEHLTSPQLASYFLEKEFKQALAHDSIFIQRFLHDDASIKVNNNNNNNSKSTISSVFSAAKHPTIESNQQQITRGNCIIVELNTNSNTMRIVSKSNTYFCGLNQRESIKTDNHNSANLSARDAYNCVMSFEAPEEFITSTSVSTYAKNQLAYLTRSIVIQLDGLQKSNLRNDENNQKSNSSHESGRIKEISLVFKQINQCFYLMHCNRIVFGNETHLPKHLQLSYDYSFVVPMHVKYATNPFYSRNTSNSQASLALSSSAVNINKHYFSTGLNNEGFVFHLKKSLDTINRDENTSSTLTNLTNILQKEQNCNFNTSNNNNNNSARILRKSKIYYQTIDVNACKKNIIGGIQDQVGQKNQLLKQELNFDKKSESDQLSRLLSGRQDNRVSQTIAVSSCEIQRANSLNLSEPSEDYSIHNNRVFETLKVTNPNKTPLLINPTIKNNNTIAHNLSFDGIKVNKYMRQINSHTDISIDRIRTISSANTNNSNSVSTNRVNTSVQMRQQLREQKQIISNPCFHLHQNLKYLFKKRRSQSSQDSQHENLLTYKEQIDQQSQSTYSIPSQSVIVIGSTGTNNPLHQSVAQMQIVRQQHKSSIRSTEQDEDDHNLIENSNNNNNNNDFKSIFATEVPLLHQTKQHTKLQSLKLQNQLSKILEMDASVPGKQYFLPNSKPIVTGQPPVVLPRVTRSFRSSSNALTTQSSTTRMHEILQGQASVQQTSAMNSKAEEDTNAYLKRFYQQQFIEREAKERAEMIEVDSSQDQRARKDYVRLNHLRNNSCLRSEDILSRMQVINRSSATLNISDDHENVISSFNKIYMDQKYQVQLLKQSKENASIFDSISTRSRSSNSHNNSSNAADLFGRFTPTRHSSIRVISKLIPKIPFIQMVISIHSKSVPATGTNNQDGGVHKRDSKGKLISMNVSADDMGQGAAKKTSTHQSKQHTVAVDALLQGASNSLTYRNPLVDKTNTSNNSQLPPKPVKQEQKQKQVVQSTQRSVVNANVLQHKLL